jgi:hypothetical protein
MKNVLYITENTLDLHYENYLYNNLYLLPETDDTHAQNTVENAMFLIVVCGMYIYHWAYLLAVSHDACWHTQYYTTQWNCHCVILW